MQKMMTRRAVQKKLIQRDDDDNEDDTNDDESCDGTDTYDVREAHLATSRLFEQEIHCSDR